MSLSVLVQSCMRMYVITGLYSLPVAQCVFNSIHAPFNRLIVAALVEMVITCGVFSPPCHNHKGLAPCVLSYTDENHL